MKFWERMSLILRADAHGVLDGLQDRKLMLKQHLRDAELALACKRDRLAELERDGQRLLEQQERLDIEQAALEHDVTLALQADNDALAKKPLERLLGIQQLSTRLSRRLRELNGEQNDLRTALSTQEAEFELLRTRIESFVESADNSASAAGTAPPTITAAQVELALLRRKQTLRQQATPSQTQPIAADAGEAEGEA